MWGSGLDVLPKSTVPFFPLVSPTFFVILWVTLCAAGLVAMGTFFVYELSTPKSKRDLFKEITLAAIASVLLGFGVLFLVLWAGVWL